MSSIEKDVVIEEISRETQSPIIEAVENNKKQTVNLVELEAAPKDLDNSDFYKELASQHGWNPEGKKSAKEYVEYALGNYPKKIAALEMQNKQINERDSKVVELELTLSQLVADMSKQKQMSYDQALKDLKAQRTEAIRNGDTELVERIEDAQVKAQEARDAVGQDNTSLKQQAVAEVLINNFRKENPWASGKTVKELEMRSYARMLESELSSEKVGLEEQLETLNEAVRAKFPEYFTETVAHSAVEGGSTGVSRGKNKQFGIRDLDESQRAAANYFASKKIMSVDEYIAQLVEQGDLK